MLSKLCIAFCILSIVMARGTGQGGNGGGRGGQGGQGGPGGPGGHHGGPPPPPFLQNVTEDARKAFFDIVSNGNLTQNQIESQTAAWASTYGVSKIYNEFQQNKTAFEAEIKQNMTTVIGNLATVNSQLETIFSNKDQTRDQVKSAIDSLKQTYPVEVDAIMFISHPHGGPGGPRGGPRGEHGGFGGNNSTTQSTKAAKKANKKNSSSR